MKNAEIIAEIKALARTFHHDCRDIRRHIHRHPELSFQEFKTSDYVASKLDEYGIPYTRGWAKTGIVATITGQMKDISPEDSAKTVVLRADMDALPVDEANETDYKSETKDVMHACGHDVHMSCLLGAARILKRMEKKFRGQIILVFQPGEEKLPGGARVMLEEGALKDITPDAVIAQHVFPDLECGYVGFRSGLYLASADEIYITVKGKGGHAALKNDYINPIPTAARIILDLDTFIKKHTPETIPTILAFGKIIASGATNVIPGQVEIAGTFRTMDEAWREQVHKKISEIAQAIAREMKCECHVNIPKGYPTLKNDPVVTSRAKSYAEEYIGKEQVADLPLRMASEDFAFFAQQFPSTLYRLGTANKTKNITSSLHTSTFDIDEDALPTGIGLLAWLAFSFLSEHHI